MGAAVFGGHSPRVLSAFCQNPLSQDALPRAIHKMQAASLPGFSRHLPQALASARGEPYLLSHLLSPLQRGFSTSAFLRILPPKYSHTYSTSPSSPALMYGALKLASAFIFALSPSCSS
jgi:hypothetical protein